jgi:hypothetical protein
VETITENVYRSRSNWSFPVRTLYVNLGAGDTFAAKYIQGEDARARAGE